MVGPDGCVGLVEFCFDAMLIDLVPCARSMEAIWRGKRKVPRLRASVRWALRGNALGLTVWMWNSAKALNR